jgi:hypothetical protein
MAERDFGYVEAANGEQHGNAMTANKPLIITVIATVFAMICFAVGFYMGEQHGLELNKGNKHEELISKLQKQKQEIQTLKEDAQKRQAQEANTSQVGELTFYNELPDQSINPEPLDAKPLSKDNSAFLDKLEAQLQKKDKHSAENTAQTIEEAISAHMQTSSRSFRIQVASFRENKEALALTYKLGNIGVPAEVQRIDIQDKGVYYRVYTKSYMKEQDAIQAKSLIFKKLKLKGIMVQNG